MLISLLLFSCGKVVVNPDALIQATSTNSQASVEDNSQNSSQSNQSNQNNQSSSLPDFDFTYQSYSFEMFPNYSVKGEMDQELQDNIHQVFYAIDSISKIIYIQKVNTSEASALFISDYDGTNKRRLSTNFLSSSKIQNFSLTSDNSKIVYLVQNMEPSKAITELYVVNIDGTGNKKLSPDVSGTLQKDVYNYKISPDNSMVAFRMDYEIDNQADLYRVDIDGQNFTKLSQNPSISGRAVEEYFDFTPDSSKVLFVSDYLISGGHEIFSVNSTDASSLTKINPSAVNSSRSISAFKISSDSTRVIYTSSDNTLNPNDYFLHSALIDGSADNTLSSNGNVSSFEFHPTTNTKIIAVADQFVDNRLDLVEYDTTIFSSTNIGVSITDSNGDVSSFKISPMYDDSGNYHVVFSVDNVEDTKYELYGVNLTTKVVTKISKNITAGAFPLNYINVDGVKSFDITEDGQIVYLGDFVTSGIVEIISNNFTATNEATLMTASSTSLAPDSFKISSDEDQVVFTADLNTNFITELYSVPINGSSSHIKISANYPSYDKGGIGVYSANNTMAFYTSDVSTEPIFNLYGAEDETSESPTQINGTTFNDDFLDNITFFSDDDRVIFHGTNEDSGKSELYLTSSSLSNYEKLSPALPRYADVYNYKISPNNDGVIYTGGFISRWQYDLYYTPLTSPYTPVRLSSVSGGMDVNTSIFDFSTDGAKVAYLADQTIDGVDDLYVTDTSASSTTNATNFGISYPNADVKDFKWHPGGKLVFIADITDGDDELFSVNIDGTGTTKISDTIAGSRSGVSNFKISPDGNTIAYISRQDNDALELFSTNIDGSASITKLSPNIGTSYGASMVLDNFVFTSDSQRIVFLARNNLYFISLYSVKTDGTEQTLLNTNPLGITEYVSDFKLADDDETILYTITNLNSSTISLYKTHITDPNTYDRKINTTSSSNSKVNTLHYLFSKDNSKAIYIADHDENNVFELYSTSLTSVTAPTKLTSFSGSQYFSELPVAISDGYLLFKTDFAYPFESSKFYKMKDDGSETLSIDFNYDSSRRIGNFKLTSDESKVFLITSNDDSGKFKLEKATMNR